MCDILAIKGSARRNGNSDRILESALAELKKEDESADIETLAARDINVTPCRSCYGCWETGVCVIKDQMQDIYRKCLEAKSIVVASPIYFTTLPGQLKVIIDRFQCFWVRTYRLENPPEPKRNAMFLCVGAMDNEKFFNSAKLTTRIWLSTINAGIAVSRFYPKVDAPDDVLKYPAYLEDAAQAAREFKK